MSICVYIFAKYSVNGALIFVYVYLYLIIGILDIYIYIYYINNFNIYTSYVKVYKLY